VTRRRRGALVVATLAVLILATVGCSTESAGRSTTTTTRSVPPATPRVLVLGDSNVFESAADIDAALRNVGFEPTIHGVPGLGVKQVDPYWSEEVPRRLESDPGVVVVGLGTNDAVEPLDVLTFAGRLDQMMELIGDRPVVWITHVDDRPAAPAAAGRSVNAAIRAAPLRWPNLTVLDFTASMAEDPTILRADGLHFSASGMKVYGTAIALAATDRLPAGAISDRG
jgi:hypothetical protein